jgi:hypothetical protein
MLFEVIEPQKANNINLGTFFTRTPILLHITPTNTLKQRNKGTAQMNRSNQH